VEVLNPNVLPENLWTDLGDFTELAKAYKQINAPVRKFGLDSLKVSTVALESDDANDQSYIFLEDEIGALTEVRNALGAGISQLLEKAEFNNGKLDHGEVQRLSRGAENLLQQMQLLMP